MSPPSPRTFRSYVCTSRVSFFTHAFLCLCSRRAAKNACLPPSRDRSPFAAAPLRRCAAAFEPAPPQAQVTTNTRFVHNPKSHPVPGVAPVNTFPISYGRQHIRMFNNTPPPPTQTHIICYQRHNTDCGVCACNRGWCGRSCTLPQTLCSDCYCCVTILRTICGFRACSLGR